MVIDLSLADRVLTDSHEPLIGSAIISYGTVKGQTAYVRHGQETAMEAVNITNFKTALEE